MTVPYRGAPPSPEAIKANEELLERMAQTDSRSLDPKLRVISGKIQPNPSTHPDPRMNLQLADIQQFYHLPQKQGLGAIAITTKRAHKPQVESEKSL